MAIEYLTGLNAIVMKAIWNIEKRQGRVTIQDLVEEIKRNTEKEYHRNSVSTYLRRLEKKDFIGTKKEGRRSFIYSKVDESDYHKVQFEQMKKVWFDDSWDEFSVALSDVVKQEENDKLRRLIVGMCVVDQFSEFRKDFLAFLFYTQQAGKDSFESVFCGKCHICFLCSQHKCFMIINLCKLDRKSVV